MTSDNSSGSHQRYKPLLSIIICTYKRPRLLQICINSLVAQKNSNHTQHEIIVVDNNSKDQTKAVVSGFKKKLPNLRYTHEGKQGLSHARNKGCQIANGAYLAYLDDDAKVGPDYIENVKDVIQKFKPDILGGPIYPFYMSEKPKWFKDSYEIRKFASHSGFSLNCRISGGNFIIRKDLLLKLGCFDVNLGMKGDKIGLGEERALLELYREKTPVYNQKVYYSLKCAVEHFVPYYKMHRRYMAKRCFQIGRTAFRIKGKNPASAIARMINFIPDQAIYFINEIKVKGYQKADYVDILMHFALRSGTIAGAFSYG